MQEMPDLNIRGMDESLMREVRIKAAGMDLTLRDYVIRALRVATNLPEVMAGKKRGGGKVGKKREGSGGEVEKKPQVGGDAGPRNCGRCGKPLIEWGEQRRCTDCQINYPR